MAEKKQIHENQRIGRWTVLNQCIKTDCGEKKWLCRCDCGTERYVLERTLKAGGSLSCGCLRKERAAQAITHDLAGQCFGDLKVIGKTDKESANRGIWWTCRCSCGNTCDVLGTLLVNGRKTHCGCKTVRKQPISDITGRVFGRLTALYPTDGRTAKGSVLWHCICTCGREIDVSYNDLLYTSVQSCGCQKKEHDLKLGSFLTHVAGTSVDMLKSKKIPTDNTTGYRGVYLIKGRYVAKIVFQKKAYYLGTYNDISDAAEARKEAEEVLFDGAAEHYAKWKKKADEDPDWALENPIQMFVNQDGNKRLSLIVLPVMGDEAYKKG